MDAKYQIYVNKCLQLARSLIIKYDFMADTLNQEVIDLGLEVAAYKKDWRYYMHLAGEYHSIDTQMTITSLDDGSEIVFNRSNLEIHKKTKSVYLSKSSYVDALIIRYPKQRSLILGILHPIDKITAINASSGTILYYDSTLVDKQETALIRDTENYIKGLLYRFSMEGYAKIDNLFTTFIVSLVKMRVATKLLNIRDTYVKTDQTCDFLIEAYLASHGGLDQYIRFMNTEQKIFLYHNIIYIENNIGLTSIHDLLIEKLFTLRKIPVFSYALGQRSLDLEDTLQPKAVFIKTPVNLDTSLSSRNVEDYTIQEIIEKEVNLAPNNMYYTDDFVKSITDDVAKSTISNIPTTLLEAAAIDPEDVNPIKLMDVLLNEWLYLAANNKYVNKADVTNPATGGLLKLDTKQLYLVFIFAYYKSNFGIELKQIPSVLATGIMKQDWISKAQYNSVIAIDRWNSQEADVNYFIETQFELYDTINNASDFMSYALKVLKQKRNRYYTVNFPARYKVKARREALYDYSYLDVMCDVGTVGMSYSDFFTTIGLDTEIMSDDNWGDLGLAVLDAATHYATEHVIGIREVQTAMIKLFKQLSCYTVQFIDNIASDLTTIAPPNNLLIGDTLSTDSCIVDVFKPFTTAKKIEQRQENTPNRIERYNEFLRMTPIYDRHIRINTGNVTKITAADTVNIKVIKPFTKISIL